jgi:alpha-beta hydrolase superfamily lysophospholipase
MIAMVLLVSGGAQPENVDTTVRSFDGTKLHVRVFPVRPDSPARVAAAPTVVIFHGWLTDINIYHSLAVDFCRAGWNVLLFDQRNHGLSDRTPTTWGAREKRDAKIVVDRMLARGLISDEIHAFGGSMGGCIAIQYAAYDSRVRSCLAAAPVNGLRGAKRSILPLATTKVIDTVVAGEAKRIGYDPEDASPERAIRMFAGPVCIIGGRFDIIVPAVQCREIFAAANEPKEYIELPANHLLVVKRPRSWFIQKVEQLRKQSHTRTQPPAISLVP